MANVYRASTRPKVIKGTGLAPSTSLSWDTFYIVADSLHEAYALAKGRTPPTHELTGIDVDSEDVIIDPNVKIDRG